MAETEYTNDVLHNSKLNVSVDFLNINIRIKLYDLKREYQIKIIYFLQKKKKKEPDLYRNFIFNYYFAFDIHKILYREGIKKKKDSQFCLFHVSSKNHKKKKKERIFNQDRFNYKV